MSESNTTLVRCGSCGGNGYKGEDSCGKCGGTGHVRT